MQDGMRGVQNAQKQRNAERRREEDMVHVCVRLLLDCPDTCCVVSDKAVVSDMHAVSACSVYDAS